MLPVGTLMAYAMVVVRGEVIWNTITDLELMVVPLCTSKNPLCAFLYNFCPQCDDNTDEWKITLGKIQKYTSKITLLNSPAMMSHFENLA